MEYNLKELARWINTLETNYELSDSARTRLIGITIEDSIAHWLHGLTSAETEEVLRHLNDEGQINYDKYFKNK